MYFDLLPHLYRPADIIRFAEWLIILYYCPTLLSAPIRTNLLETFPTRGTRSLSLIVAQNLSTTQYRRILLGPVPVYLPLPSAAQQAVQTPVLAPASLLGNLALL